MLEPYPTIEIEKKLLSALMLDEGAAIPAVSEILKAEDFYRPEHKIIYAALLKLSDENKPVDILLVEKAISPRDLKAISHRYLFNLIDYEYTTARATLYAKEIKKYSTYRRLKEIGERMELEVRKAEQPPDEIQAHAEEALSALSEGVTTDMEPLRDILMREFQIFSNKEENGLQTRYWYLDNELGGLKRSDLIILAARPAMGKTALALNIAVNVSREHKVAFFSLEMSKTQLAHRVMASAGRVDATRIQRSTSSQEEINYVAHAITDISDNYQPLLIDDTGTLSLYNLRQRARKIKRERGLDLVVVDYLQLIRPSKEYKGNRVQEVSEISRGLKALARELDIPVLALSQLSRGVELRADKRPQLSDLRESGSIEQDADIVMFLYREEYYDKDSEAANIAEINVAKNRNGKTLTFRMHYEPNYLLFSDLTREK